MLLLVLALLKSVIHTQIYVFVYEVYTKYCNVMSVCLYVCVCANTKTEKRWKYRDVTGIMPLHHNCKKSVN